MKSDTKVRTRINIMEGMIPPDGHFGWIIVISYAMANFIGIPTTSNIGLIFKDKFNALKIPAADMTLILNINSALSMAIGLINGPLLRRFGYRIVSVMAAILFSCGLILTALTDTFSGIAITYGVVTAIGYGMSNSSFSLALNLFFTKRLCKASGIAMTLAGIGPIIYPPLMNFLLSIYGVDGCMLIIGGIALNMLVAAVLLQPMEWHMIRDPEFTAKEPPNYPAIPNVPTFLSIGKYSESSFVPNSGPRASGDLGFDKRSSRFDFRHDIDTQSIYGFDQIIHRQPSHNKLDQATIARNFSKRTLNATPTLQELDQRSRAADRCESPQMRNTAVLFEAGSMGSGTLAGSSTSIFCDASPNPNGRRQSILPPLRSQSQNVLHGLRNKPRQSSNHCISNEESPKITNNNQSMFEMPSIVLEDYDSSVERPPKNDIPLNTSTSNGICKWLVRFFDLDLLRDNIYLNIMIGMAITIFAETNFAILTPFILSDLNFNSDEIAIILLVMAVADLISRFCSPFIADQLHLSIRVSFLISLVLLVLTRMSIMLTSDYVGMLIVCSTWGIAKGIRSVYMSIVIPSYIPIDRLASASAIQLFANGIAMMCIGPVLGLIKDTSGSYIGCIFFLNACTCITIAMYSIELTYTWYTNKFSVQSNDR